MKAMNKFIGLVVFCVLIVSLTGCIRSNNRGSALDTKVRIVSDDKAVALEADHLPT